ncbi:MAG: hypothetical protein IJ246_09560 [Clostridia bacterium]|nr:hypothetical protein [Clostridia bacterium]
MQKLLTLHYYKDQGQTHCCHQDTNEVAELQFEKAVISDSREENCERLWVTSRPLFQGLVSLISGPEETFSQTLGLCRSQVLEEYCLIDGQPVEESDRFTATPLAEEIAMAREALRRCHEGEEPSDVLSALAR